jgi:4-amino-4-deoxy-L-arabinose transferase-like glycosyltransferase
MKLRFQSATIVVVLAILGCYLFDIGGHALVERTEARYASIAWEMVTNGDWLIPRYNGIKHFHKPPVTFWLTALSLRCFGFSEFAYRFPVTLFSLGTILITPLFLKQRRLMAAAVLASSWFFYELSRFVLTDMYLTFSVTLALLCAWQTMKTPESKTVWLFWVSLAASFMIKGPIGLFIVFSVLVPYTWRYRINRSVFRPGLGLPLFLCLALPWYIYVAWTHPGLVSYFVKHQTVDRVVTTVHHRAGPIWFYLPAVLGGFFPWALLLPTALRRGLKKKKHPDIELFLSLWVILPLLFFSLMGSKLHPYVLPLFPAIALLITLRDWNKRAAGTLLAGLGVALVALAALLLWAPPQLEPFHLTTLLKYDTAIIGSCLAFGLVALWKGRLLVVFWATVALGLGLQLQTSTIFRAREEYRGAKQLAAQLQAMPSHPEVATFDAYLQGLPCYLGHRVLQVGEEREVQFETEPCCQYYRSDKEQFVQEFRDSKTPQAVLVKYQNWNEQAKLFQGLSVVQTPVRMIVLNDAASHFPAQQPPQAP